VREQAVVAAVAAAAGDVPGHDNEIARLHMGHAVGDVDHLGDALVTDRKRRWHRRPAGDDHLVHVAGRRGDRPHDGVAAVLQGWVGRLAPGDLPVADVDQLTHVRPFVFSMA